jgi:hypothetical protein
MTNGCIKHRNQACEAPGSMDSGQSDMKISSLKMNRQIMNRQRRFHYKSTNMSNKVATTFKEKLITKTLIKYVDLSI